MHNLAGETQWKRKRWRTLHQLKLWNMLWDGGKRGGNYEDKIKDIQAPGVKEKKGMQL